MELTEEGRVTSRLGFIVSILLLRKILTRAKIKYKEL